MTTIIRYSRELNIKNVDALPAGTGCRYLECITSHIPGEYVAKQWHRKMPTGAQVVIIFRDAAEIVIRDPRMLADALRNTKELNEDE